MPGQHCPLLQFGTSHLSFRGRSSFSWNLCCNCFRVLTSLSVFILLPSLLYRTELLNKPFVHRSLPQSLFPVDLNLNKQQTLQEDLENGRFLPTPPTPPPFKAVESLQQNSCLETSSCKYGERGVSVLEVGGSPTVFAYFGSLILCQDNSQRALHTH